MAQAQELEKILIELRKLISNQGSTDPLELNASVPQIRSSYGQLTSPSRLTQKIVAPFQRHIYNLSSIEEGLRSLDIITLDHISSIVAKYRAAEFIKLECVFIPNHGAFKHPFTVDVLWAPQSTTLTAKELPDTPGCQTVIIGGTHHELPHVSIKCDLKSINPRIKDSVNYNDTPRLFLRFIPNQELKKTFIVKNSAGAEVIDEGKKRFKTCRVYLKGQICLHSPTIGSEGMDDD